MENDSPLKDSTWAYPRTGFWIAHVIGILLVGYLGYYILSR
jgi:hypothetical protein